MTNFMSGKKKQAHLHLFLFLYILKGSENVDLGIVVASVYGLHVSIVVIILIILLTYRIDMFWKIGEKKRCFS